MAKEKNEISSKSSKEERNGKHKKNSGEREFGLREETIQGIAAIAFIALTLFFVLAAVGYAGLVGEKLYALLYLLLGLGYYLLPALFLLLSLSFLKTLRQSFALYKTIGSVLFFISGLGLISVIKDGEGGLVGSLIASPLVHLFDTPMSVVLLLAILIISLLVILDAALTLPRELFRRVREYFGEKVEENKEGVALTSAEEKLFKEIPGVSPKEAVMGEEMRTSLPKKEEAREEKKKWDEGFRLNFVSAKPYAAPPLTLLEPDKGKPGVGDIKSNANIIKRTLQNFGIEVEMDEVSIGPSITRYALKPAEGVKLSKIVALQSNLELALAAHPIRIEAPIPGKSLVGIEIPNSVKSTVGLGTLLGGEEFQTSNKPLLVALGKGISGKSHFADLGKMPHLLIAGATGSGKSVTIHAIIASLLFRNSPEQLRVIMVDPKRVELTLYNKIPHLLTPVITDPKKAIMALKWAAKEMERRYNILEAEAVRDIESYHKNVVAPAFAKREKKAEGEGQLPETMPYIVVIVDELAEIMQTYPKELEASIVRLAQMSRAVGIHLILSTQRPSVNVITGLIKANVPARIALQVASQIDSRTILDASGAEKLLGAGDMLYLSGDMGKPVRVQSAFISETEVKKVAKHLSDSYQDEIPQTIELGQGNETSERNALFATDEDEVDDELYEEARAIVVESGIAATSYLQRKLRVGYARAARLMDILEERGVIGPADGSKRRTVIGVTPSAESEEATLQ